MNLMPRRVQRSEICGAISPTFSATPFSPTISATPKILSATPKLRSPNLVQLSIIGWFYRFTLNHILLSNVISTKYGFKPFTTTFRSVMKTKRQCHISCYTVRTLSSVARFQLSLNEAILSILLSEYLSYKRKRICTNSLLIPDFLSKKIYSCTGSNLLLMQLVLVEKFPSRLWFIRISKKWRKNENEAAKFVQLLH